MELNGEVNSHNLPFISAELAGFPFVLRMLIDTAYAGGIQITDYTTAVARGSELRHIGGPVSFTLADGIHQVSCRLFKTRLLYKGEAHDVIVYIPYVFPKMSEESRIRTVERDGNALLGSSFLRVCRLEIEYPEKTVSIRRQTWAI